jgi:hypothetical protein
VKAADVPKLGVLLPEEQGQERLIGFPVVLQMVRKEPPLVFSSATETVNDLANDQIQQGIKQPPHRLEIQAKSCRNATTNKCVEQQETLKYKGAWAHEHWHKPVGKWDVYVDNFTGLVQGNAKHRKRVKYALLRSLDLVFLGLNDTDGPHRQEPASVKKLLKGNATWATRKTVLGWVLHGHTDDPDSLHRVERLHTILAGISKTHHRTSTKKWQQVIGELRSMALAVPGARWILCSLQKALRHKVNDVTSVRLGSHVHPFFEDFRWLAEGLATRPISMLEVIPYASPATRGACDASDKEMGGVHFMSGKDGTIQPYLWRSPSPLKVTQQLVITVNPTGKLSNSDLELAGSVDHHDILYHIADVQDVTIDNCYENTATLFWQRKGSTTTTRPAAYLLRLQAIHKRHNGYAPLHDDILGEVNLMVDVASRSGDLLTLNWSLC